VDSQPGFHAVAALGFGFVHSVVGPGQKIGDSIILCLAPGEAYAAGDVELVLSKHN
jgi:hypothetical protein